MKNKLWTMRIPVISTCHIKQDTLEKLSGDFRVADYEEGAFVCVIKNKRQREIPAEFKPVLRWLRREFTGQNWIRFDRDGDEVSSLPKYDW